MKIFRYLMLTAIVIAAIAGCKAKPNSAGFIELAGTIKAAGMTTYQYGTHVLQASDKTYALKSSSVNLNDHLDHAVTIIGKKVEGYPVENGPDLIEVAKIK